MRTISDDGRSRPTNTVQPRQLIVTIYGLYARKTNGWLSIATVVQLMANLGVDEQAVRSSIWRLKRRGLITAHKIDNAAGYQLSEAGQELLAEGDTRIFGRRRTELSDGWLLVVFSVPESERDKRHRLRAQLTRLGFGTTAPGVWIGPGHVEAEANEALERHRLTSYVQIFRGAQLATTDVQASVRTWWDLDALQHRYTEFLAAFGSMTETWHNIGTPNPQAAFVDYVELLTAWRSLPYADPGLPHELLPDDWNGTHAQALFLAMNDRLSALAADHVRAVSAR